MTGICQGFEHDTLVNCLTTLLVKLSEAALTFVYKIRIFPES